MYVDTTASVTWTTYDDVTASDVSADVTVMWNCTPYPHHQDVSDVVEVFCGGGGERNTCFRGQMQSLKIEAQKLHVNFIIRKTLGRS